MGENILSVIEFWNLIILLDQVYGPKQIIVVVVFILID